ncbi:biotin/lipoyl-binding carrier protein [Gordonia phthalatica]|uniref:Acetyl-CoA carboxylase n=1 Tax=Gordonia phthalatica TaxID=1136941 RepID=A0A0N9NI82_9ACTN|nr:biotin/lipoyl-binding carrier protein [Gordonia phthalatica]ALG85570.1 acetyl-CoA carboxylase [Gordonia phthalatica]
MAEDVVNEIVATVLEVSAEAGQRVETGDTLVLLESMKMEIPVLAEDPGVLAEVKVKVGDVIQAGDIIATYKQD